MPRKCAIQPVRQVAGVRRVADDYISRTVGVDREGVLVGADVAAIDAAQTEAFQMPD
jgi:hypothetical protein